MHAVLLALVVLGSFAAAPQIRDKPSEHVQAAMPMVSIRTLRPNTLAAEIGWNSLSGAGLMYSRSISPYFSLDTGIGLSGQAAKIGLRGRANFLASDFTPFVAAGMLYGTGTPVPVETVDRGNPITYAIGRSPFVQGTTGAAWTTRSGFTAVASIGWAQLLRSDNVRIEGGTPTHNQFERLRAAAGSGPTIAAAMGYSF